MKKLTLSSLAVLVVALMSVGCIMETEDDGEPEDDGTSQVEQEAQRYPGQTEASHCRDNCEELGHKCELDGVHLPSECYDMVQTCRWWCGVAFPTKK